MLKYGSKEISELTLDSHEILKNLQIFLKKFKNNKHIKNFLSNLPIISRVFSSYLWNPSQQLFSKIQLILSNETMKFKDIDSNDFTYASLFTA